VNSGHFTIRKRGGVEARRLMRVLVEPETDRVLWCHVPRSLCPGQYYVGACCHSTVTGTFNQQRFVLVTILP
jgi:hypothetical protein